MVSSLGYDVRTGCAASRAGLARRAELPFTILEGDFSPGLAVGHPVPLLGGGFEGDGRLIRLLQGAFGDLQAQGVRDELSGARIAFYVAIPSSDRERQGLNLIPDDETRADYLEQMGEASPVDEFARARKIVESAMRLAGVVIKTPVFANNLRVAVSGHAAVVDLFQRAQTDFQSGRIDVAIVAAVDSLVTQRTLNWLYLTHRLKGAESPAGLFPGEAAAVLVLRNGAGNESASRPGLARIEHPDVIASPTQFLSGQPPDGHGQFKLLRALKGSLPGVDGPTWVIVDQNGEAFRANDWGCSLVRLQGADGAGSSQADIWYPAASFGDVGAASGAVAACVAASAFERGYAPSAHAVVMVNGDGADRGGCVVSAMEQ